MAETLHHERVRARGSAYEHDANIAVRPRPNQLQGLKPGHPDILSNYYMIGIAGDDPPRLTDTQLLTSLGAGGVGFHTKGSFRRELIAYLVHVYIMRNQSRMESI